MGYTLEHHQLGYDFSDGSEAKKASGVLRNNHIKKGCWAYSAKITNIKNKTGMIRAMIYNHYKDCFYYYAIPHEAYKRIEGY